MIFLFNKNHTKYDIIKSLAGVPDLNIASMEDAYLTITGSIEIITQNVLGLLTSE